MGNKELALTKNALDTLATLLVRDKEAVLANWRNQVREIPAASRLDTPTLDDHMPLVLDELATACRGSSDETIAEALAIGSPSQHGLQRLQDAFDIEEVVAEYNILRGCVYDLADANDVNLRGRPAHVINRVFDGAIGLALQTYATQRAMEVQRRREEYLAFVAHDLRTPLSAISLAARVLELTLPDGDTASKPGQMLKALGRNVKHLEELVGKVLEENTNLESELGIRVERRRFDLWPLIEGLTHDLHPVAGTDSTRLVNEVPDDLVVYADAKLLRRVFQNLIANAIKYTPRGEVVIGARALPDEHVVETWVADTGAGIPADFIDKVFDKGESDPDAADGSGLGLAIVKTFTEANGGTVSVESREGEGSTFRVRLPDKPD